VHLLLQEGHQAYLGHDNEVCSSAGHVRVDLQQQHDILSAQDTPRLLCFALSACIHAPAEGAVLEPCCLHCAQVQLAALFWLASCLLQAYMVLLLELEASRARRVFQSYAMQHVLQHELNCSSTFFWRTIHPVPSGTTQLHTWLNPMVDAVLLLIHRAWAK
jgi:hypothetical protein